MRCVVSPVCNCSGYVLGLVLVPFYAMYCCCFCAFILLLWAFILSCVFHFSKSSGGSGSFGFQSSSGVLGVIWFLVYWFVSDLELLCCFGAPVVIWCHTAYCYGEE
jgi:hypothetical protein